MRQPSEHHVPVPSRPARRLYALLEATRPGLDGVLMLVDERAEAEAIAAELAGRGHDVVVRPVRDRTTTQGHRPVLDDPDGTPARPATVIDLRHPSVAAGRG